MRSTTVRTPNRLVIPLTSMANSCLSVTTACATGTTAIGEAFRAIRDGYAEAAICGGSEAAITPLAMAGFTNAMALSTADPSEAWFSLLERPRAVAATGTRA